MARIRTVKPELFRHLDLFKLEVDTGLPMRIAWIGLFTVADREGRFAWKGEVHKLDILPFDDVDFEKVLDVFWRNGLIIKYKSGNKTYGCIPTFNDHQVINGKEQKSRFPDPYNDAEIIEPENNNLTRDPRVTHACSTMLFISQGEGKGTGREKEEEGKGVIAMTTCVDHALPKNESNKKIKKNTEVVKNSQLVKKAYSDSFKIKYGSDPVWSVKENVAANRLITSIGIDQAIELAGYYPNYIEPWHVKMRHSFVQLEKNANQVLTDMRNIKHLINARNQNKTLDEKSEEYAHKEKMLLLGQKEELGNIAFNWAKREFPNLKDRDFDYDKFLESKNISPQTPYHELKEILLAKNLKEISA